MHIMFTAKVLPPANPREEDSKPILRPAQPSHTPPPPQTSEQYQYVSQGFLLLILHQTEIPAGKSAKTQEMQLTTETHKKSEFFKAVRNSLR